MRTWMVLALLALAGGLGACGGGSADTAGLAGEDTITTPASTSRTTAGRGAGRQDGASGSANASCVAQGILVPPYNEGTCVQRGTRYSIANARSVVRLRTLNAALRGFSVAETVRGATPQGVFMVVAMRIQNTTDEPQRFAPGQTLLMVEERQYEERRDVERTKHREMLAFEGREAIPPGEVADGSVVFDIPLEEIERVTARGVLYVVNFGGNPRGRQPEFGQFRIYQE